MENVCLKIIDSNNLLVKSDITKALVDEGFNVIDVDKKTSEFLEPGKYAIVIVTREFEKYEFEDAYQTVSEFLESKGIKAQCKIVCLYIKNQRLKSQSLTEFLSEVYGIDKIIKPEEWNSSAVSIRILAALYGGIGEDSIEKSNLPQFKENADLYLPCAMKFEGETKKLNFIGAIRKMREIFSAVKKRHSLLRHPVLILGDTGTGKELMASVIHSPSGDEDSMKKFIDVNIAEFGKDVAENEMFGHVKGGFTGASSEGKKGVFDAKAGETIFLDEIGDLELRVQVKLLRVLNNRQFKRIGDQKTAIAFKGRLIFATNKNLTEMIAKGEFREDFYYRIADEIIEMPPLKDRKGDLELLAKEFFYRWKDDVKNENKRIKETNPKAETYEIELKLDQSAFDKIIDAVIPFDFGGNVRRYQKSLVKFFKSANTKTLSEAIDNLKKELKDSEKEDIRPSPKNTSEENRLPDFSNHDDAFWHGTYEEIENRVNEKIAERFKDVYKEEGNVTKACERLRIARNTFYYFKGKKWKTKSRKKK